MFSAYTQAIRDRELPEEDIRVLSKIIPDFLFDMQGEGEAFEDIKKQMGLSGETPLGEAKTKGTQLRLPQGRATGRGTAGGSRAKLPQARRRSTSSTATRRAPTGR